VVIALVAGAVSAVAYDRQEHVQAIAGYLALVNLMLAVFNIVPGFPLDGGRVLRSIAWKRTGSFRRATEVAAGVGTLVGYGLMFGGLAMVLGGYVLNGIWFGFIGWFLLGAARGEVEGMKLEGILSRLTVRNLMTEDLPTATPGAAIQQIVDEEMLGRGHKTVMIANDGRVLGILTVSDVSRLPREEWPSTPAQRVMTPREKVVTVEPGTLASDLLALMSKERVNQVPVVEDGRLVGIVTREDLLERVSLADRLGPGQVARRDDAATGEPRP
jgi:CBS domain-containing protein